MRTAKPKESPDTQSALRQQLLDLLRGGQAHTTFDEVVKDFPAELRGAVPPNLPYSAWQLLEHLRIALHDIFLFSAPPTGGYQPMQWPEDYWPKSQQPPTPQAWDQSIDAFRMNMKRFEALIETPESDLFKPFRWGDGQTLLREALLVADHTAYHLGELVVVRRILGTWHK